MNNLRNQLNSFDEAGGAVPTSSGVGLGLRPQKNNPAFQSQIDIQIQVVFNTTYITNTEGDIRYLQGKVAPEDLPIEGKVGIPVILFGHSDFAGGYQKAINLQDLNGLKFIDAKIVTSDSPSVQIQDPANTLGTGIGEIVIPSYARAINKVTKGDMILTYLVSINTSVPTQTALTIAEVIIKCKDVAYGTLLNSISSDLFTINGIRYSVPALAFTGQFDNAFTLANQSLFGKVNNDTFNPMSQLTPQQQQSNVVDLPFIWKIDKNKILVTYINFDTPSFNLSLFIPTVAKLK